MSQTIVQHAANAYTQKLLEYGRPPVVSMTAMEAAVNAALAVERERCAAILEAAGKTMMATRSIVITDAITRIREPSASVRVEQ